MKKKRYVEKVAVANPCNEDWEQMVGNDQIRFCTHCAKDVNNLSAMTRKEAMRLVRRSNGKLCIRYAEHPETRAPLFSEQTIQISRRAPRVAAGLMGASLSLSTLAYAQGGARAQERQPTPTAQVEKLVKTGDEKESENKENPQPDPKAPANVGSITGQVLDNLGAVLPGATIILREPEGKEIATATTDELGRYRLDNVAFARYELEAKAPDLQSPIIELRIRDASAKEADLEMTVAPKLMTTGSMGVTRIRYIGPVMRAVEEDEIEQVRELLAAGEDVNRREDDDTTPLFVAVERGNLAMVRLLLEFGAKVDISDEDERTPLMMIDEDASLELVELLLREGAKASKTDDEGNTALIHAAENATPEVLRALIKAGAEIDKQNDEGMSALMVAADDDNLENVRFLLNAGAEVNLRDKDGDNAWDHAAELEVEELLVAHGVQLDPEDEMSRKFYEPEDEDKEDADEPRF